MPIFDLILEFFRVTTHPDCRHDAVMAVIYALAVPTVIVWHRWMYVIYLMAFAAYAASALETAALF
jgi:hypothetical protein